MKMRSSEFMDKGITELSDSQLHNLFDDEDDAEDYSFHSHSTSALNYKLKGWSLSEHIDPAQQCNVKARTVDHVALVSEINRKVKEHSDILLHAVECFSARVSQLETRTHRLQNSIDDFKDTLESGSGRTDGKLTELTNILREVQGGLQDLRDKQEIADAQLQLAKLKGAKVDARLGMQNDTVEMQSAKQETASNPQQGHQPLHVPVSWSQLPTLSSGIPSSQSHQNQPSTPAAMLSRDTVQLQQETCFPQPGMTSGTKNQQYQLLQTQIPQPPPLALHQAYRPPPPLPQTLQFPMMPQQHTPCSLVDSQIYSSGHHPEEVPVLPSHSPSFLPSSRPPCQQLNMNYTRQLHDEPSHRAYSGFHSTYPDQQQFASDNVSSYGASSSHRSRPTMHPSQLLQSPSVNGESRYSQLPTVKVLPNALPTASSVNEGSDSGVSGKRIPVDDVVDKVVAMGFRRDLVRATVKKLTENGQSVDLNVVLDKLMNDGNS